MDDLLNAWHQDEIPAKYWQILFKHMPAAISNRYTKTPKTSPPFFYNFIKSLSNDIRKIIGFTINTNTTNSPTQQQQTTTYYSATVYNSRRATVSMVSTNAEAENSKEYSEIRKREGCFMMLRHRRNLTRNTWNHH